MNAIPMSVNYPMKNRSFCQISTEFGDFDIKYKTYDYSRSKSAMNKDKSELNNSDGQHINSLSIYSNKSMQQDHETSRDSLFQRLEQQGELMQLRNTQELKVRHASALETYSSQRRERGFLNINLNKDDPKTTERLSSHSSHRNLSHNKSTHSKRKVLDCKPKQRNESERIRDYRNDARNYGSFDQDAISKYNLNSNKEKDTSDIKKYKKKVQDVDLKSLMSNNFFNNKYSYDKNTNNESYFSVNETQNQSYCISQDVTIDKSPIISNEKKILKLKPKSNSTREKQKFNDSDSNPKHQLHNHSQLDSNPNSNNSHPKSVKSSVKSSNDKSAQFYQCHPLQAQIQQPSGHPNINRVINHKIDFNSVHESPPFDEDLSQKGTLRNSLKLTKLSNFSNLDESMELTRKLATHSNHEFADYITQSKQNEFHMECNDNITFRKESNRAHKGKKAPAPLLIPQEDDEFIFHDVNVNNTADRNSELLAQIGELKNSIYSYKDDVMADYDDCNPHFIVKSSKSQNIKSHEEFKNSLSMSKSEEAITSNVNRNLQQEFAEVKTDEMESKCDISNITNQFKPSLNDTYKSNVESISNNDITYKTFNTTKNSLASLNSTLLKSSGLNRSKPKRTPKNFNQSLQRINKINANLTKCNLELTRINGTINDLHFTINNQTYQGLNTSKENHLTQEKISKLESKKQKILKEYNKQYHMKKYYELDLDIDQQVKSDIKENENLGTTTKSKKTEYRKLNLDSNTSIKYASDISDIKQKDSQILTVSKLDDNPNTKSENVTQSINYHRDESAPKDAHNNHKNKNNVNCHPYQNQNENLHLTDKSSKAQMQSKYQLLEHEQKNNIKCKSIPKDTVYIDEEAQFQQKKYKFSCSSTKKHNYSMISDSIHVSRPYKHQLNIDETEYDISQYSMKSNSMCYSNEKSDMKREFAHSQKMARLNLNSVSKLQKDSMSNFESQLQCINEKSASKLKMLNNMLSEDKSSGSGTHEYNIKFKLLEDQNRFFVQKLEEIESRMQEKDRLLLDYKDKNNSISEKYDRIVQLVENSIKHKMEIVKSHRNSHDDYMLSDTGRQPRDDHPHRHRDSSHGYNRPHHSKNDLHLDLSKLDRSLNISRRRNRHDRVSSVKKHLQQKNINHFPNSAQDSRRLNDSFNSSLGSEMRYDKKINSLENIDRVDYNGVGRYEVSHQEYVSVSSRQDVENKPKKFLQFKEEKDTWGVMYQFFGCLKSQPEK